MHQHKEVHWTVALRIMAYVKNSPGKGLLYKKHKHVRISRYSDSAYAGDKKENLPLDIAPLLEEIL